MQSEERNEESSINLGELVRVLWKNAVLIAAIALCVLIVGAVYTFGVVREKYKSSATVVVALSDKNTEAGTEYDYTNSLKLIETVASLVTEDVVLEPVAAEYGIGAGALKSMVNVSYKTTNFLLSVSVENESPTLSKNLANAIVAQLIEVADHSEGFEFIADTITQTSAAKDGVYSSPNKTMYLALSLFAGGALGCAFVLIKEFASSKFKTKKDVESVLGQKVVGYFIEDKTKESKGRQKRFHASYELLEPTIRNYEPYNNLLTNIKYSDLENPYKVVMITSSREGELKSTVLSNLAACSVRNGKKALVIDLDVRRPVDYKFFKVSREQGLVEYLEGACSEEEIVKHSQSGVDVITSGKKILNPVAIIENGKLAELIRKLRNEYDYIFVDTPPVLVCSDANSVSKLCDGVIFNVAMNDVRKKEAKEALNNLEMIGARVIGVNVTKGVADRHGVGYYYYNKEYYTDGSEQKPPKLTGGGAL